MGGGEKTLPVNRLIDKRGILTPLMEDIEKVSTSSSMMLWVQKVKDIFVVVLMEGRNSAIHEMSSIY